MMNNVMDVTMTELDRIFGKNDDSEDDFDMEPPQTAGDNVPNDFDMLEEELKDFIMDQRKKNTTIKADLCVKRVQGLANHDP